MDREGSDSITDVTIVALVEVMILYKTPPSTVLLPPSFQ